MLETNDEFTNEKNFFFNLSIHLVIILCTMHELPTNRISLSSFLLRDEIRKLKLNRMEYVWMSKYDKHWIKIILNEDVFMHLHTHTHIQMKQMCSSHVSTDGQTTTTETTVVVVIYIDKNIQTTEKKFV